MGVVKTIGNKQYQKDANGDWYEVPMPEQNAQTKVVNGRTYQKDQSGEWYDMGPVKKKEPSIPLGETGGRVSQPSLQKPLGGVSPKDLSAGAELAATKISDLTPKRADVAEAEISTPKNESMAELLRTAKKSPQTQADIDREAKWKGVMEPELYANKEELVADPVGVISRLILSSTPGVKNRTVTASSTFVDKPLGAKITEKETIEAPKKGDLTFKQAQKLLKETRDQFSNNTTNSLEHLRQLVGATNGDQLYSYEADAAIKAAIRPGNETDRLSYDRLQEAKAARNSIRQNIEKGKGFEDMAVDFMASQDPQMGAIIKQLKDTPSFREMLDGVTQVTRRPEDAFGNATIGRMMYDFVTNTAVQEEISKVPGLTGQFRAAAGQLIDKYPEFGKKYLGQLISQKMEDMGLNNSILNIATKSERDKAFDALEKEGIVGPNERRFYEEYIRPLSGTGLFLRKLTGNQIIDTPGAIENTLGSFYQGVKSIPKGLYELTAKDAVLGQQGALSKDLENTERQVSIKPNSLINEITQYGGQFLGQSVSIGAGANLLTKLKAVASPKVAMGLMGGVQAYANYMPLARQTFPGDQLKQQGFATILASLEMATENIFNDRKVVDALLGRVKPGVSQTIRQFTNGKISAEAARENISNLIKKAIKDVPDAAKYYAKGVFENTVEEDAAQLGQQVTAGVFDNKPINEWIDGEELWETTRQAALGSAFIAGLSAKSDMRQNRGITAKSIYAMAQEAPYWKQQMQDAAKLDSELAADMPDKIANLEYAAKVVQELEKSGLSEKQKVKFVINALEKKVNEKESADAVVPELQKEAAKELDEERKAILSGEDDGTIDNDKSDETSSLTMLERVQKSATEGMAALYDTEESLTELKDQALTTPANINEKLSNDEELTTDLIAKNAPQAIKASLDEWVAKMKNAEDGSIEFDEAEAHVALLERGLEKAKDAEQQRKESSAVSDIPLTIVEKKDWSELSMDEKRKLAVENLPDLDSEMSEKEIVDEADRNAKYLLAKLHGEEISRPIELSPLLPGEVKKEPEPPAKPRADAETVAAKPAPADQQATNTDNVTTSTPTPTVQEGKGDKGGGDVEGQKALKAYPELKGTKVVNEDGTPKIVYHGGRIFDGFKIPDSEVDKGIYFTDNPDFALYFAHQAELVERDKRGDDYSDVPNDILESGEPFPEKYLKYAKLHRAYLDMKNPKEVDAIDAASIPKNYEKGKDGFIAKTTGDFGYKGGQYVVFDPKQIKSADTKAVEQSISTPTQTSTAQPPSTPALPSVDGDAATPAAERKKPKEKGVMEKARGIEDLTDPVDIVMQYFVRGNKINSSAIQELYGGKDQRLHFSKGTGGEHKSKISLLKTDAPGIKELAHRLWEDSGGLEDGYPFTDQDFREAIETVLQSHNSPASMAKELVSKYIETAVRQEMTDEELNLIQEGLIRELGDFVEQMDENEQFALVQVLRQYQDSSGFINWEKLEDDYNGFEPIILDLPTETKSKLYAIIQKNLQSGQSEYSDATGKDGGKESQKEQANERLKTAQSSYDNAAKELQEAEDKIAQSQAKQTDMFGGTQKEMFAGDGRESAKQILDPLRAKVKEAKAELNAAQKAFDNINEQPQINFQEPPKGTEPVAAVPEPSAEAGATEAGEAAKKGKTKFSQAARGLAQKIREEGLRAALPDWAKADLPDGTEQAGFGGKWLDEAIAKAIEVVSDLVDTGVEIGEAIKQGYAVLKDYYEKNTKSFDEKKVRRDFEINMKGLYDSMNEPPPPGDEEGDTETGGSKRTFNFFKNRVLSKTGEQKVHGSKDTFEEGTGEEIDFEFNYNAQTLDEMEQTGLGWVADAKKEFNGTRTEYAEVLYRDLKALKGKQDVKAVALVSLLNSIDNDLRFKDRSQGERDILRNLRQQTIDLIADNARLGSLTLNAQRLIYKMYRGNYKYMKKALDQVATTTVNKKATDAAERMKSKKSSDVSDAAKKQRSKQAQKEPEPPKEKKQTKKQAKKSAYQQAYDNVDQKKVSDLKKEISELAKKLNCGKKK